MPTLHLLYYLVYRNYKNFLNPVKCILYHWLQSYFAKKTFVDQRFFHLLSLFFLCIDFWPIVVLPSPKTKVGIGRPYVFTPFHINLNWIGPGSTVSVSDISLIGFGSIYFALKQIDEPLDIGTMTRLTFFVFPSLSRLTN